jgi:hypothetical protein
MEDFIRSMNDLKGGDVTAANNAYLLLIGKHPDDVMKSAAQAKLDEGLSRNAAIDEARQDARDARDALNEAKAALQEAEENNSGDVEQRRRDVEEKQEVFDEAKAVFDEMKETKWDKDDIEEAEEAVKNAKAPTTPWFDSTRIVQHTPR